MRRTGRPENEKRNRQLVKLRDKDPERWPFARLGKKFGIAKTTAYKIYKRRATA